MYLFVALVYMLKLTKRAQKAKGGSPILHRLVSQSVSQGVVMSTLMEKFFTLYNYILFKVGLGKHFFRKYKGREQAFTRIFVHPHKI